MLNATAGEIETIGPLNAARRLLKYSGTALLFYAETNGRGDTDPQRYPGPVLSGAPHAGRVSGIFPLCGKSGKGYKGGQRFSGGYLSGKSATIERFANLRNVREEITIVDEE